MHAGIECVLSVCLCVLVRYADILDPGNQIYDVVIYMA